MRQPLDCFTVPGEDRSAAAARGGAGGGSGSGRTLRIILRDGDHEIGFEPGVFRGQHLAELGVGDPVDLRRRVGLDQHDRGTGFLAVLQLRLHVLGGRVGDDDAVAFLVLLELHDHRLGPGVLGGQQDFERVQVAGVDLDHVGARGGDATRGRRDHDRVSAQVRDAAFLLVRRAGDVGLVGAQDGGVVGLVGGVAGQGGHGAQDDGDAFHVAYLFPISIMISAVHTNVVGISQSSIRFVKNPITPTVFVKRCTSPLILP